MQHTNSACNDAGCNQACYEGGGSFGGACASDGSCQCKDVTSTLLEHAEYGQGALQVQGDDIPLIPPCYSEVSGETNRLSYGSLDLVKATEGRLCYSYGE